MDLNEMNYLGGCWNVASLCVGDVLVFESSVTWELESVIADGDLYTFTGRSIMNNFGVVTVDHFRLPGFAVTGMLSDTRLYRPKPVPEASAACDTDSKKTVLEGGVVMKNGYAHLSSMSHGVPGGEPLWLMSAETLLDQMVGWRVRITIEKLGSS